ncbi:MAG TPA: DUF3048 domain-containing protein [Anaerolineales bacterium]|nr:DUF3048 domain-containing protein [Anaerolineales bacterium]
MSRFSAIRLLLVALILAACSPAPAPTALAPVAATSTTVPAPTEAPATVAPTSPPTEAIAAALPTATATEPPALLNPLTGLPVDDPAVLARPPLAIKVAHFPRAVREAQAGLSLADNVWEVYAEGGVTRFNAIFWSQMPQRVGNVRSARLLDAILMDAYQALLVTSGSSTGTMNRLREDAERYQRVIAEATDYGGCPVLCREASATLSANKLFTEPAAVWAIAAERELAGAPTFPGYVFDPAAPVGTPIATVHLDWQLNNTIAEWRYDAAIGRYWRWIDSSATGPGNPALVQHIDTLTGAPLVADTIVMVTVPHVASNIVVEDGAVAQYSYDVLFTGAGPAKVFRDGVMVTGSWERAEGKGQLPRFLDEAGEPIALKPGVTWFAVYVTNSPETLDAEAGIFQSRFKAPGLAVAP